MYVLATINLRFFQLNVLERQADKVAAMLVTVWDQTPVAVTLVIEDPSVTTVNILSRQTERNIYNLINRYR